MTERVVSNADVVEAYQHVLATREGQIVIADLHRLFGYTLTSTYTPEQDATAAIFREGQRSVLVHIGRRQNTNPDDLRQYENAEREE